MKQPDKYELAIRYLEEHPEEINGAWFSPAYYNGGCLFALCVPGLSGTRSDGAQCGCLTQIRSDFVHGHKLPLVAWTDELTVEIQQDSRIPIGPNELMAACLADPSSTRSRLEPFAEWQRRLDRELNRV